jgi:hypothetical protein
MNFFHICMVHWNMFFYCMLLLPDVSKFQLVTLGAGGSDPGPN